MPTIKLTRTAIDRLQFDGTRADYFDTKLTGFGVRVNAASKTYFVHARTKAGLLKETIGKVSVVDFDDAYERAKKMLDDASMGALPTRINTVQITISEPAIADITLEKVLGKYLEMRKLKPSTTTEYNAILDTHLSDWKDQPIRAITGAMVLERHASISAESPARADGVMRVLRALCTFAIDLWDDEVMTKNPCRKLTVMRAWNRVGRKKTFLPASKIRVWMEAIQAMMSLTVRDAILMLLFTGARLNEVCALEWSDVDLREGTVHFRDTKTGELLVPLCGHMVEVLERRKEYAKKDCPFVFPGHKAGTHLKRLQNAMESLSKTTGHRLTPHDFRRSFLSYCESLKIPVFTQKRLVSHALPQDVTEGYVQFTIDDLRLEVERVASYILRHAGISEPNVVSLEYERSKRTDAATK